MLFFTAGVGHFEKTWCPDCDKHMPEINKVIEESKIHVIKAIVSDKNLWVGKNDHPYKQHPILAVAGVPTVLVCQDDKVLLRSEQDFGAQILRQYTTK